MRPAVIVGTLVVAGCAARAATVPLPPYESAVEAAATPLDLVIEQALGKEGVERAPTCSDAVFLRRVWLDVAGTVPEAGEVRAFLADKSPDKRARLVDKMLESPEHAAYMAMKWGDVLRIKAEFPINLWPNAVQGYARWVREAMAANLPHDRFARELLTSSGSNFRVPQVNFLRAVQGREPAALAAAAALTFMGTRLELWPADRRTGMEAFFSRVQFKPTAEWKEEVVCLDPAPGGAVGAMFPDGRKGEIEAGRDPREVFAAWLTTPDNPWFARAAANRIWSWFMGRGIVHEADDLRPDNPPSNPELLDLLEREFKASGFDRRALVRMILNSRAYQRTSIPRGDAAKAEAMFGVYPVRRLDAEVLVDALCRISGTGESYSSPIPEPFTFLPSTQRAVELPDGSITSSFLEMFGRPARDTGYESERSNQLSEAQRLHLLNSTHVLAKIRGGGRLRQLAGGGRGQTPDALVHSIYLAILSRPPTGAESAVALEYLKPPGSGRGGGNLRGGAEDLAWALVNSKEFLHRH